MIVLAEHLLGVMFAKDRLFKSSSTILRPSLTFSLTACYCHVLITTTTTTIALTVLIPVFCLNEQLRE